jgi:hypothetical protein
MLHMTALSQCGYEVTIAIGGVPVLLRTEDPSFRDLLEDRYAGFLSSSESRCEFDVELVAPREAPDEDVQVAMQNGTWLMTRGDFRAEWDPRAGKGRVRQSANPYSIDSVLRIVHSLVLAREGGFLLHSASAIRNGRAFLFSGVSGAGKTTISRLAPPDVTLLTDEISYVRREKQEYRACGTPFAGELARVGTNCSAPVASLFFLHKGPENRIEPVPAHEALQLLLRNILFFANDSSLVSLVFEAACEFVQWVPVHRLTFFPDEHVWEIIG